MSKTKGLDGLQLPVETIIQLTFAREQTRLALVDLLAMWDRRDDQGWTYAEIARLEEIRIVAGAGCTCSPPDRRCQDLTTINNRP